MSDTPRTNNYVGNFPDSRREPRLLDFARQLERELSEKDRQLAEARTEIDRLKAEIRDNNYLAARQIVPAEMAVDDLRAEIERKDKLIEQMLEALGEALGVLPKGYKEYEKCTAALDAAEKVG